MITITDNIELLSNPTSDTQSFVIGMNDFSSSFFNTDFPFELSGEVSREKNCSLWQDYNDSQLDW